MCSVGINLIISSQFNQYLIQIIESQSRHTYSICHILFNSISFKFCVFKLYYIQYIQSHHISNISSVLQVLSPVILYIQSVTDWIYFEFPTMCIIYCTFTVSIITIASFQLSFSGETTYLTFSSHVLTQISSFEFFHHCSTAIFNFSLQYRCRNWS